MMIFHWPPVSTQALLVLAENMDSTQGHCQRYQKNQKTWIKIAEPTLSPLEKNGLAWGKAFILNHAWAKENRRDYKSQLAFLP